jgi:hypothetical protein
MIKTITITLAAALALSGPLAAAEGVHHHKRKLHKAARPVAAQPMRAPASAGLGANWGSYPCRTIPGMSSNNRFGVDNDLNVYRNKPQC